MSGLKAGFDVHEYGVKVAVLLADWQPERLPGGVGAVHAPLADDEAMTPEEAARTEATARRLAAEVAELLEKGAGLTGPGACARWPW